MAKKGFILVEVMVTTIVMAIGVVGISRVFSTALGIERTASEQSKAIRFYEEEIFEKQVFGDFEEGSQPAISNTTMTLTGSAEVVDIDRYPGLYRFTMTVESRFTRVPPVTFQTVMKKE